MSKRQLADYPQISLQIDDLHDRVDFAELFGRTGPVHIEIGSGTGTFLVNQAKADGETNFLGIEWANKYYRHAVDRIGRWALTNVRIIRTDAACFITDNIADESIACFHIYFPDPWPKKRHHKRRFICQSNTAQLIRCLIPGGIINIATDHADYFLQIEQVIRSFAPQLGRTDFVKPVGAEKNEWAGTNFERKYLQQGKPIYAAAARKR